MLWKGLSHLRLLAITLLAAGPAQAAPTVFTVDTAAERNSAADLATNCTLGDALTAANADAAVDGCSHPDVGTGGPFEIVLPAGSGPFVLERSETASKGRVGLPIVRSNVTIRGNGNAIERNIAFACPDPVADEFRLLEVARNARLTVEDLGLHNGCALSGGAVHSAGQLVLRGVLISNNAATSGDGGGVSNDGGNAEIVDSTIADNRASDEAGGIYNVGDGILVLKRSTVARNSSRTGGGLQNSFATATLLNSTVSGNSATEGGGIANGGGAALTVLGSTIATNQASQGQGLYNYNGSITFANTILADRCFLLAKPPNLDAGHNLERRNTCGLTAATSIVNVSTGISGLLADNGGPTDTHEVVASSPAIDAGDPATCAMLGVDGIDQRGVARPDGDAAGAGSCDIGAVEFADCDGNGLDDGGEIRLDPSLDADANHVLDACEDKPPVAMAGGDQVLACSSAAGAEATLDGSGSSDPEGGALTYAWSGPFGSAAGETTAVMMPLGTATVGLQVADAAGNVGSDELQVTVEDTAAPTASAGLERIAMNGDLDDVKVQASCSDVCDGSVVTEALFNGASVADGDVVQIQGFEDASTAPVLTVRCVDASGNTAEATAAAPARDPVVVEPPRDSRWERWQAYKARWEAYRASWEAYKKAKWEACRQRIHHYRKKAHRMIRHARSRWG